MDADVNTLGSAYLVFDISHLSQDELLELKFYSDMINNLMATENRTESQVMNEATLKANYISTSVSAVADDKEDTSAHPVFIVNYYGFEDEFKDTFDLVADMLFRSKVSDIATYGMRTVANMKTMYQSQLAEPISLAMMRAMAYTSPIARYQDYLSGLGYYNYILSMEKQISSNPSDVVKKMEAVRTKAFNKNNLTIMFAGDKDAQEKYTTELINFTCNLSDKKYEKATHSLPLPAKREAWVINTPVQYVCMNGSLSDNNVAISGKADVITNMLNNLMLTPEIRLKGGAYGVGASASRNNFLVYTYRDSNFVNSMNTIRATGEFLKSIQPYITEEVLETYKLSAYAAATQGSDEISEALTLLIGKYQGITIQDMKDSLTQIKEITPSDIKDYAQYLDRINSNMNYIIAAPASEIEKYKDLFDTVIALPY